MYTYKYIYTYTYSYTYTYTQSQEYVPLIQLLYNWDPQILICIWIICETCSNSNSDSRVWVGPRALHFWQAPRRCCCCGPRLSIRWFSNHFLECFQRWKLHILFWHDHSETITQMTKMFLLWLANWRISLISVILLCKNIFLITWYQEE